MKRLAMDHESRANRLLDVMGMVGSLLAGSAPGLMIEAEPMAQLFDMLCEEAGKVVVPFRMGANDDGEESG